LNKRLAEHERFNSNAIKQKVTGELSAEDFEAFKIKHGGNLKNKKPNKDLGFRSFHDERIDGAIQVGVDSICICMAEGRAARQKRTSKALVS